MAKQIENNHNHLVYCPRCKRKVKWSQLVKCPTCAFQGCEDCGWKKGERCRECIDGTRDKLPKQASTLSPKEEWDKWAESKTGRAIIRQLLAEQEYRRSHSFKSKTRPRPKSEAKQQTFPFSKSKRRPNHG